MIRIENKETSSAIEAALADLRRDLATVFPAAAETPSAQWILTIAHDNTLAPETFVLEIIPDPDRHIRITGGDDLGIIYAIYEFSHRYLGVDPLWFWKDIPPPPLATFDPGPAPQRITSQAPAFRYRGWFINDEDLLDSWPASSGRRFDDWPRRTATENPPLDDVAADDYEARLLLYYTPIATPATMDRVYEALLRLRGNLIIPASFTDITHEPEAALIRAAIRRGLYVSQHHVEPLGVSHFAYETWCSKNNYTGAPFSYREAPDVMRACWRAHTQRWHDIAGDRVIWQIGLRGRGDRALWSHDPASRTRAAEFIASALADQLAIIRSIDPRPAPPATLTLWLEGAQLVSSGQLQVPAGVTCVFADHHLTQEMQEDFATLPRTPGLLRGFYYHIAVWTCGPHLVQGPPPSKIARIVNQLHARGDTHYAILNVSNVREHVMGAQCFMEQVNAPAPLAADAGWLARWSPPGLAPLHEKLLAAIPEVTPGFRLYDGAVRHFIHRELIARRDEARRSTNPAALLGEPSPNPARDTLNAPGFPDRLRTAIARLADLHATLRDPATAAALDPRHRSFFATNLLAQTQILLGLYRALAALYATPADDTAAIAGLETALAAYPIGEHPPRWRGWYAHDTKMALATLLALLRQLRQLRQPR
ncbi:glycosyl hydrolase 115 family protein, partial [Geminisphaera colitermitum]|uniref:glycosyl hydrolase 115 family protein n=1 Tax=Geminisphaera colitermitum TaxID=1148786 RepID=UPI00069491B8